MDLVEEQHMHTNLLLYRLFGFSISVNSIIGFRCTLTRIQDILFMLEIYEYFIANVVYHRCTIPLTIKGNGKCRSHLMPSVLPLLPRYSNTSVKLKHTITMITKTIQSSSVPCKVH